MTRLVPPSFWYRPTGSPVPVAERILLPFSKLYAAAARIYQRTGPMPVKLPIPVLCIGNINVGGTGKTPAAIALMALIRAKGLARKPAFLLRGYGGTIRQTTLVRPGHHTAVQVGDEALLLARHGDAFIAYDRLEGAREILRRGHDLIIMDDGFQNKALHKDLQFVVVNGALGFGNGHLLPAGPLREPLADGMRRADGFFLIGADEHSVRALLPPEKPVWTAKICAALQAPISSHQPYLAFAGLGNPKRFFDFMRCDLNLRIVETRAFPDHHHYQNDDLRALTTRAQTLGARLITTEKDAVRLPPDFVQEITVLPIALHFDEGDTLASFIKQRLAS